MDTSGNVVFDYEVTGSAASSIDTGAILNGDVDGWYTIIFRMISAANSNYIKATFNSDGGTNYGHLGIAASVTTVSSAAATGGNKFLSRNDWNSSKHDFFCCGNRLCQKWRCSTHK